MRRLALVLAVILLGSCGGDADKSDDNDGGAASTTTGAPAATSTPTTTVSGEAQSAMWPAADIVFATPQAAAKDFVAKVLDVAPSLGDFQQGDSRSGEINVFSPGEGGSDPIQRATLVLRQLGPKNGWFVISAESKGVSITNLSTGDEVVPSKITVQGQGRGFEGTLVATAYVAGDDGELSKAVTQGGSMAETAAYKVSLDLSAAKPNTTVFVLVRGGTGLETDPGEFAAIPLTVS